MADIDKDSSKTVTHKEVRSAEVAKGELAVNNTMDSIENFMNPFCASDMDHLYSLSSGLRMPVDIEKDVHIFYLFLCPRVLFYISDLSCI